MTFLKFRELVLDAKSKHPRWFELESDPVASEATLAASELALGTKLPEEYKAFVKSFGGGYFALGVVFSAGVPSKWNIVTKNLSNRKLCKGFVVFSENGSGDLYGFKVVNGECSPEIWIYDHESGAWQLTSFANLFDFLSAKSLRT